MSDFVESAKHFVNAAVSRTSWEAQKQLRVRGKQGEIDKLLAQRRQLLEDIAGITMKLYQQGALTDPQLSRLCASVFELDNDVKNRDAELQEIKSEKYLVEQSEATPNYVPPTPASPPPATPKCSSSASVSHMWEYTTSQRSILSHLWDKSAINQIELCYNRRRPWARA